MKFKYRQKKPKILQDILDKEKQKQDKNYNLKLIKNCVYCGHPYNTLINRKICTKCFNLLPIIIQ